MNIQLLTMNTFKQDPRKQFVALHHFYPL
uniref:Uncharacterized protein n=1 Tax=Tetranychus urticae TaxID=32264 RepID=T1JQY5_TETUR